MRLSMLSRPLRAVGVVLLLLLALHPLAHPHSGFDCPCVHGVVIAVEPPALADEPLPVIERPTYVSHGYEPAERTAEIPSRAPPRAA